MTIAIFPGGFKPPHTGHYLAAKYLAKKSDRVIVRIGLKPRDGINAETSLYIWKQYLNSDPDPLADKIIVGISKDVTPLVDVKKYIKYVAPFGSRVLLAVGEKDQNDTRFSDPDLIHYANKRMINIEKIILPMFGDNIMGADMRNFIKNDNKREFFKSLPPFISDSKKENIWNHIKTNSSLDEFMMGTMNKQEMTRHKKNMKKLRKWMNKQGDQMVPFPTNLSKGLRRKLNEDWWLNTFNKHLISEGGVAGHMPHPFELPHIMDGNDLINLFKSIPDSIDKGNSSVKIDGINTSIKLVNTATGKEFALDRGAKKDIEGVTSDKLKHRFKDNHPLIDIGYTILEIFNTISDNKNLLETIGMWDNPDLVLNIEYVKGKTNTLNYKGNYIVIHGIMERNNPNSLSNTNINNLIKAITNVSKSKGFKVLGSIPAQIKSTPRFEEILNKNYSIKYPNRTETKTLQEWVMGISEIPKHQKIKINHKDNLKNIPVISKLIYSLILNPSKEYTISTEDYPLAVNGAVIYLFTEIMGDVLLNSLSSPIGDLNNHEGVVINDKTLSPKIFKITGKFISLNKYKHEKS